MTVNQRKLVAAMSQSSPVAAAAAWPASLRSRRPVEDPTGEEATHPEAFKGGVLGGVAGH